MPRHIAQASFDEAVKENVESFGLAPDEAVRDAVSQFEAQGVDLADVLKDAGGLAPGGRPAHPSVALYAELGHLLDSLIASSPAGEQVESLVALLSQIAENGSTFRSHRDAVALTERAMAAAIACEPAQQRLTMIAAAALRAVCTLNDGNRAAVSVSTVSALLTCVSTERPAEVAR